MQGFNPGEVSWASWARRATLIVLEDEMCVLGLRSFGQRAIMKANGGLASGVAAMPAPQSTGAGIADLIAAVKKEEVKVHVDLNAEVQVCLSRLRVKRAYGTVLAICLTENKPG